MKNISALKAIGYCRVSSAEQVDGTSLKSLKIKFGLMLP